jgi:uncharacterized protein (UPF0333 family)
MDRRTPAQTYALVVGGVLLVAGIIGFFYESKFTDDKSVRDAVFGILDVNGWHNLVHAASGALGLAMARAADSARTYALLLGIVYLVVTVWGFAVGDGDSILSIIPVNTEDNILHLLISLAGFGAYAASDRTATDRPAATAA